MRKAEKIVSTLLDEEEDEIESDFDRYSTAISNDRDRLEAVAASAIDAFTAAVDRHGINNSRNGVRLAQTVAGQHAAKAGYAKGSEEREWVKQAVAVKADEMFPTFYF